MARLADTNSFYGQQHQDIRDQINAIKGGYTNSVLGLANQGLVLQIASATGIEHPIQFVAFMEGMTDSFNQNFNKDSVFGRMDPIQSFKNTERSLSMNFKLLAANQAEAERNMFNISELTRLMYPSYIPAAGGGNQIQRAPVMAIKYMNLIADQEGTDNFLLGTISSLTITPDLEFGVIQPSFTAAVPTPQGGSVGAAGIPGEILPKIFSLSITFAPIHSQTLKKEMNSDWLYETGLGAATDPAIELPVGTGIPPRLQDIPDPRLSPAHAAHQKSVEAAITSAQTDNEARFKQPWKRVGDKFKQFYDKESKNFKP